MILPSGVKQLNQKQMLQMAEEVKEKPAESLPQISTRKVSDVEYDEDYDSDKFNEIPLMAQTSENATQATNKSRFASVREFSIDMWNGSPGLKHWGYDDTNHSR